MKNNPFVIERTYNAPVEKVWKAITDRDAMKEWYFDLAEFKPEPGFEFQFTGGADDRTYLHLCKVIEVEKNRKISYSWTYDGYEGYSVVTFELTPEGEKTKLRLTHEGLETFPSNMGDFARKNFEQGWTEIIGTSLRNFVEGVKVSA
jgi:uncharacterized protein YndB with AHSA1/START domain